MGSDRLVAHFKSFLNFCQIGYKDVSSGFWCGDQFLENPNIFLIEYASGSDSGMSGLPSH